MRWLRGFAISLLLINLATLALADAYRSRELAPPTQEQINAANISVEELELRFNSIDDDYSKASTARYLARHYLQKKQYAKAEKYYQASLLEQGLSDYAKQDILAELAQVQMLQQDYPAVLQALDQRAALGGKDDNDLLMLKAIAYLHTQQVSKAIQLADTLQQQEKQPSASFLQQLLFIYFSGKAYQQAAMIQQQYLAQMPNDIEAWKLLTHIYLQLKAYDKATNALSIAWIKGLRLQREDILQLAELYAVNDAPYSAARLLAEAIAKQQINADVAVLERQIRYWLLAREKQQAADSLKALVKLQPSIEHYLQLAQLQMQAKQWQAMRQSVLDACGIALPDEYVGKANLLLGISEFHLNNIAAARYALINATLIGGVIDEANAWLAFIDAQAPQEQETQNFHGVCTPKWARTKQLAITSKASAKPAEIGKVQYQIKRNQAKTLFVGEYTLAVAELEKKLLPLVMQMGMAIAKNRGRISGSLYFLFPEIIEEDAEVIHFQMAFPISKKPDMTGRYKIVEDQEFTMAVMLFDGDPVGIKEAWKAFAKQLLADGVQMTGEARQVVIDGEKATKERVKMELQLGIVE